MIQCQNNLNQSINKAKVEMSQLFNLMIDKNEKTLPNTFLIIPDSPNHIDEESWYLEDLTKIQFHHIILNLTNISSLTN